MVSTGARGGVTPQWGGKTPPHQPLCRHWQGPWPQEGAPRPPVGLCGACWEWSCSACSCSVAPLLTLSRARRLRWGLAGTRAAGDSAPSLRSQARKAPEAQHLFFGPWPSDSVLSAAHVCFPGPGCAARASAARVSHRLPDGASLSRGSPAPRAAPSSDSLPKRPVSAHSRTAEQSGLGVQCPSYGPYRPQSWHDFCTLQIKMLSKLCYLNFNLNFLPPKVPPVLLSLPVPGGRQRGDRTLGRKTRPVFRAEVLDTMLVLQMCFCLWVFWEWASDSHTSTFHMGCFLAEPVTWITPADSERMSS